MRIFLCTLRDFDVIFFACIVLTTSLVTCAERQFFLPDATYFIFTFVLKCKADCLDMIKIHRDSPSPFDQMMDTDAFFT